MISTYVNWGKACVKLCWQASDELPARDLITSVHGFCFDQNGQLLMVDLNDRGWDFPGGTSKQMKRLWIVLNVKLMKKATSVVHVSCLVPLQLITMTIQTLIRTVNTQSLAIKFFTEWILKRFILLRLVMKLAGGRLLIIMMLLIIIQNGMSCIKL